MAKTAHRARTEEEMRAALLAVPDDAVKVPNYDSAAAILANVVDEVLQLRRLRADVQQFVADQKVKRIV